MPLQAEPVRKQNFVVREMNGLTGEGNRQTPRSPRRVKTADRGVMRGRDSNF